MTGARRKRYLPPRRRGIFPPLQEEMNMTRLRIPVVLLPLSLLLTTVVSPPPGAGFTPRPSLPASADDIVPLNAQIVATGIPGAGAICQIGTFHLGGPFHDNAAFSPFTGPGEILDGRRLLV